MTEPMQIANTFPATADIEAEWKLAKMILEEYGWTVESVLCSEPRADGTVEVLITAWPPRDDAARARDGGAR